MSILENMNPVQVSNGLSFLPADPDNDNWTRGGTCRTSDLAPDAWFPIIPTLATATAAKAICRTCPVRERCLDEALAIPGAIGIWGGWDENERRLLGGDH